MNRNSFFLKIRETNYFLVTSIAVVSVECSGVWVRGGVKSK